MSIQKRLPIMLVGMISLVVLVSACTQIGPTGGTQSGLSVGQVIQKSTDAMKQLKSSHIGLQSTLNTQTTGGTATPGTDTPAHSNISLNIKGTGVQQLPDQEQMDLTVNNDVNVSEILQGDKVYVKNAQGKWYVLDKNTLEGLVGNPFAGITIDQNSVLGMLQNIKIVDNGDQNLNGQNLRHITAQLDKNALSQILTNNPQLKSVLGTQN